VQWVTTRLKIVPNRYTVELMTANQRAGKNENRTIFGEIVEFDSLLRTDDKIS